MNIPNKYKKNVGTSGYDYPEWKGVFIGFLVLIILIGVVISIIASSSSGNKNYSGYHGGRLGSFWGRNRDEKYFAKS